MNTSYKERVMQPPAPNQPNGQWQGLPQHALERLQIMRGAPGRAGLFTSDLSVNEFLLVKAAGFEPMGLVVGSSIYHLGYQFVGLRQNQEMTVLSQAMYHARELAMTRMEQEANALGAEGVVGTQVHEKNHGWGSHVIEYFAIGTAVVQTRADHIINPPQLTLSLNDSIAAAQPVVQAAPVPASH
jgi:uncharacterized protein YbjQ (UPF0145 family)